MRIPPLLVIAILMLLLLPAQAAGQETQDQENTLQVPSLSIGNEVYVPKGKLRLGPFAVHPYLSEYFGHNSNIYLVEEQVLSDYPLITEAGLRFDLRKSRQLFLLGYKCRHNEYTQHGGNDNTEHEATLNADFRLNSFFIKLKDEYGKLSEATPVYFNAKAKREQNRGTAGIGFDLNKLYIEAAYGLRSYHFEGIAYDSASNKQGIVTGELGYKVSPKTQIRFRYESGSVDYDYPIQNDYTYISYYLGIHYRIKTKLLSYLYVGSTSQSVDVLNNPQTEEFSGMSASGSLAYKFSERTRLNATLLRELQYSAYVNYTVVTKVQITGRYQLTQKIMLSARLAFEMSEPSRETGLSADSTGTSMGLSARYDLNRWMAAGLDLNFATKSSNRDLLGYSANTVSVFLTLYF